MGDGEGSPPTRQSLCTSMEGNNCEPPPLLKTGEEQCQDYTQNQKVIGAENLEKQQPNGPAAYNVVEPPPPGTVEDPSDKKKEQPAGQDSMELGNNQNTGLPPPGINMGHQASSNNINMGHQASNNNQNLGLPPPGINMGHQASSNTQNIGLPPPGINMGHQVPSNNQNPGQLPPGINMGHEASSMMHNNIIHLQTLLQQTTAQLQQSNSSLEQATTQLNQVTCPDCGLGFSRFQHLCQAAVHQFIYKSEVFESIPTPWRSNGTKTGQDWEWRYLILGNQQEAMRGLQDTLFQDRFGPLGALWISILEKIPKVKDDEGLRQLGITGLDRVLCRHFGKNETRRLYELLGRATKLKLPRPGPATESRRLQSSASRTGSQRVVSSDRKSSDYQRRHERRQRSKSKSPPEQRVSIKDFIGKLVIFFTILCYIIKPCASVMSDKSKDNLGQEISPLQKIYFKTIEVSSIDTNIDKLILKYPAKLVAEYLQQVARQILSAAKILDNELENVNNIVEMLNPLNERVNMTKMGRLAIANEPVTQKVCAISCLKRGATVTTMQGLIEGQAKGLFFVDVMATRHNQRLYDEAFTSIPEWSAALKHFLVIHKISTSIKTMAIIKGLNQDVGQYVGQFDLHRGSFRLTSADTLGGCACLIQTSNGSTATLSDMKKFLQVINREVSLHRQELGLLTLTLKRLIDHFIVTNATVTTQLSHEYISPSRRRRSKRSILEGLYNLFGLAGENQLRQEQQHATINTQNVNSIAKYLKNADSQTQSYRERISKLLTSAEKNLIDFSMISLFEHLRIKINDVRIHVSSQHAILRTQLRYLHDIVYDYRLLANHKWPNRIIDRLAPHVESIDLVRTAMSPTGIVRFKYNYQRLINIHRGQSLLPLPIAADQNSLVRYVPKEIIIFQNLRQNSNHCTVSIDSLKTTATGYAVALEKLVFQKNRLACSDSLYYAKDLSDDLTVHHCHPYKVRETIKAQILIKHTDNTIFIASQEAKAGSMICGPHLESKLAFGIHLWQLQPNCTLQILNKTYSYRQQAVTAMQQNVVFLTPKDLDQKTSYWDKDDKTAAWLATLSHEERQNLWHIQTTRDLAQNSLIPGLKITRVESAGVIAGFTTFLIVTATTILVICYCPCAAPVRTSCKTICTCCSKCIQSYTHARQVPTIDKEIEKTHNETPPLAASDAKSQASSLGARQKTHNVSTISSNPAVKGSSGTFDLSVESDSANETLPNSMPPSMESDQPHKHNVIINNSTPGSPTGANALTPTQQYMEAGNPIPAKRQSVSTPSLMESHTNAMELMSQNYSNQNVEIQPSEVDTEQPQPRPSAPIENPLNLNPMQQMISKLWIPVEFQPLPKPSYLDVIITCTHQQQASKVLPCNYLRIFIENGTHSRPGKWCKICEQTFIQNGFPSCRFTPQFLVKLTSQNVDVKNRMQLTQRLLELCHTATSMINMATNNDLCNVILQKK